MPGVQWMIGAGFEVEGVIPEMRSMLVGLGQPISYRAEVDLKRDYVVVLGSFEAEFGRPGIRVMNARIEGGEDQKIDVIKSVGWEKPFVVALPGKDLDGDGGLDIRVEQRPVDHPEPHYVGDMPHNWASAEFIRLILHLIVFERGDELHLFEGLPPTWLKPGAELRIDKALTRFGEVSLTLQVAEDGKMATLDVVPPARTPAAKVVVHGMHWLAEGSNLELSVDKPTRLKLKLK